MENLVSNVYPTSEITEMNSGESDDGSLVAFTRKSSDVRFLSNDWITLTSLEPITPDVQTLTFSIPRTTLPRYTYLNEIMLSLTLSLEKQVAGSQTFVPVEESDNISPSAFLHDIFFERIEVYLNDVLVSSSHNYRYVMAHLARIIAFHEAPFKTYFSTEMGE